MNKGFLFALIGVLAISTAFAQVKKPVQKPNQVKGQGQLNGGQISFGTIYSLKNGFNFEILSARYTTDAFDAYSLLTPRSDEKVLVLDIAIKNARPEDNWFTADSLFNLVDSDGNTYNLTPSTMLVSKGSGETSFNLKPGQGLGQPALKDPVEVAWVIPAKARITKIILLQGRLNSSEDVLRYMIAEPPKDPATSKNPNFIAPLPEVSRVDGDTWGSTLTPESKGKMGSWVHSGYYDFRVEKVDENFSGQFNGNPAEEGKRLVVMNVTVKNVTTPEIGLFEATGGDSPTWAITDEDGEIYKPIGYRKPSSDEDPDRRLKKGDSYTMRIFFQLPAAAKIKHYTIGAGGFTAWGWDKE